MSDNHNDGAPPAAAPAGAGRFMVIVLALLVVAALAAWFLLGSNNAPGPAATESVKSETEQSFEDTVVAPTDQVLNAPTVTEAPPTNTTP
jgi:hypothetical protein